MANRAPLPFNEETRIPEPSLRNETASSAVSWPAVIAGSFVGAALSLALFTLGTGIGLSSISPWPNTGASSAAVSAGAIAWLIIVQIIAFAMAGYIAGRLRTKWVGVHTNEVYFRDTAHGFLSWAVGFVITTAFLATAVTSIASGSAAGSQGVERNSEPNQYFVDSMLRTSRPSPQANDASIRAEVGVILANGIQKGNLSAEDRSYLADVIAARTGSSRADAERRASQLFEEARQASDTARKAISHSMYWLFLALLAGAFTASFFATIGGRQRDGMVAV